MATATNVTRFRGWAARAFGRAPARRPIDRPAKPEVVRLEDRAVPATFVVTNILDNQGDATGGLSLRQAILASNANPGFDKITFNIPISPSLPTIPGDPNENYFPIVLATTLPPLTDPDGVFIDATTQPRFNKYNPTLPIDDPANAKSYRPLVQLLPDPNPGAFPNEVGAFLIPGPNNVVRGFVVTGFPGSAFNLFSETAKNNILLNNWINTDISGTKSWNQDPVILSARPPGTPPELTNAGNVPNSVNVKHVLNGIAITGGASSNIVGGTTDVAGVPLVAPDGSLIGIGGVMTRPGDPNPIPITADVNRNVISGTPEFRKDYIDHIRGGTRVARERDIAGAGSGPGIRIMDPLTKNNLIQGNFIGTDASGTTAIPNHNGIEIYNAASSNHIGNPVTPGLGNLIRFNQHDGVRLANFPNPSEIDPPPPPNGPPAPWTEAYERWNFSVGPYGPGGKAPFYDPYNPNYFQGKTPTGADIIDGGTTPANANTTTRGIEGQVGTVVTIRGNNLNGAVSVTFTGPGNSQVNSKFTVVSDTEITATIPEGAITGVIRVFTPAGSVTGAQATILPSPQPSFNFISAFFPSQGIPSNVASDFVTIRGSNFQGATEVLFGGVPSSKFTVNDSGTEIQAFVPNGAKTGPITVVNVAGSVQTNRNFVLLVQAPPRVLGLSATSGVPGTTITITGELFSSANLVRFNFAPGQSGFATTDFTVVDDQTIVVKVPAASLPSNGTIQVVTSGGFGVSGQFQILAPATPTITTLGGGATGVVGTKVAITGANFTSAIGVTFNGVPAEFTIDSPTQITATVPFGATTGPVVVSTILNASTGSTYTVQPSPTPTISAVGTNFRNTYITIDGTNLQGVYKILFGSPLDAFGIVAPEYEVISDTQIRVLIPRQASNGSVHVFTPGGRADSFVTISDTFQPSISTQALVNPVQARVGDYVTLEGAGLLGTQRVFFTGAGGLQDVQVLDVEILSDFAVRVLVPNGAVTGPVQLEVPARVPGDPVQFVLSADFELTPTAPANISSIFPATGPVGTLVTVSGINFAGATQVLIGGFPVPTFNIVNDRQISFRIPVGAQNGPITVVGQGTTAVSAVPFAVTASPFPVVQYSTPGSVRNGVVSINGTGLAGTTQVVIGGFTAKFTIVSDFQVDAVVPLNANSGVIVVTTPGGTAISPSPFQITSAPLPQIVAPASGSLPALEDRDEGPVGSKFFLNGQDLTGVQRVEVGGLLADFQFETNKTSIQVTVPNGLAPGTYDVTVFSTVRDVATVGNFIGSAVPDNVPLTGKAANKGGSGLNVDNSTRVSFNALGSVFTYGASYTVVPNARPVVQGVSLNDSGGTGEILRGSPITILGSGFTGANFVTINGVGIPSDLFTVVNDARINTNVPISQLGGIDAIVGTTIEVSGPGGASTDSVTFDIGATPALTYNLAVNNQWIGFDKVFGAVGFQGSQVTLTASTGSFYGVTQLFMQANDAWTGAGYGVAAAPQFQPPASEQGGWAGPGVTLPFQNFTIVPGTGGRTAIATIPTDYGKYADVPSTPTPPPDAKPAAFITALAQTNEAIPGGTVVSKNSVVTVMQEAPATSGVVSTVVTGDPVFHRTIVIRGVTDPTSTAFNSLISADQLLFDVAFSTGGTGKFSVSRENFRVLPPGSAILNKGSTSNPQSWGIEVVLPAGFNPYSVNFFPTGNITIVSPDAKTTGTANFTVGDQPVPTLFQFATTERAPQDNRIVGNEIYQNGALTTTDANGVPVQATVLTNGQAGIDFVTADVDTLTPIIGNTGSIFFPFAFGYSRTDQGPGNSDLPGNEGRGGLNDGYLNSFGSTQLNNTFNNIPFDIGRPYLGPNQLQNFPLLQVVQSTVDRTTFSTALLGKPFRAYRIDYFYNPLFNDQDATALATTTAGYGEIYLGSKVITTDFQGNGSVNFTIFVKQPSTPGGPVPEQGLPSLSNFILPNNSPLPIGAGQGVVTSTATDLTVPGAFGPSITNGPDGTSRYSFFKRPDNATGGISGRVIFDANKSGTLDPNEVGIQNAKVELYVDRGDGTLSAVPNSVQTTDSSGSFAFTTFTLDGGFGLPNGNHLLKVIHPTGEVTYINIDPASGEQISTIVNGNQVTDQNFFLFSETGPGPNPPGPNPPGPNPPGPNPPGPVPPPGPTPTLTAAIVAGSDAGRQATVNVYNPDGSFRYSINPYGAFTGGVRVASADVNGDGNVDIITAPGPGTSGVVRIYDGPTGTLLNSFLPYESGFTGGVYVAMGDINGDGKAEIVTGTGVGGGPRVQVFDGASSGSGAVPITLYNFFPYEESFRGGVLVGMGDINGDGKAEIVTGTGVGGGPRVQVFDGQNLNTLANFFAYEESFRGGVFASVADLTGDGKGEIITGSGVGGGPVVKVYDPTLLPPLVSTPAAQKAFFAYEQNFRGGVRVDATDANGDGKLDVLTGPGPGRTADLRAFDYTSLAQLFNVNAFENFFGGVFVGGNR